MHPWFKLNSLGFRVCNVFRTWGLGLRRVSDLGLKACRGGFWRIGEGWGTLNPKPQTLTPKP